MYRELWLLVTQMNLKMAVLLIHSTLIQSGHMCTEHVQTQVCGKTQTMCSIISGKSKKRLAPVQFIPIEICQTIFAKTLFYEYIGMSGIKSDKMTLAINFTLSSEPARR